MLGQKHLTDALREAAAKDALHHAYLFAGPSGSGKAEAALWLAQLANCEGGAAAAVAGLFGDAEPAPEPAIPCGICHNCRLIAEGSHPDVLWVGPSEDSKARKLLIRQAQFVRTEVSRRPVLGRRKVIVLSPADDLTLDAVNCLLKTLEEPPDYATLVLLAGDTGNVIPTVLSRCQVARFTPAPAADIAQWLQDQGALPHMAEQLSRLCDGRPGEALRLWKDQAALPKRDRTLEWLADVADASLPDALRLAERLRVSPDGAPADIPDALGWAAGWFRDVLAVQSGAGAETLINRDRERSIRHAASRYPVSQALSAMRSILNARRYLAGNGSPALVMENLVMDLIPAGGAW
ncbi:MAG TPA: DNA polymerase III subunit delta' C-terminal domain-containing protein [Armatimonadota bacterium]|jgi:DNA polymerase-3 subunit delta'